MEEKTFNFELSAEDQASVETITRRAVAIATAANMRAITAQAVMMDVTVCHNHAIPLDLAGLAVASKGDFAHDVFGIVQKLDRRTGELTDCFTPRYFRKDAKLDDLIADGRVEDVQEVIDDAMSK